MTGSRKHQPGEEAFTQIGCVVLQLLWKLVLVGGLWRNHFAMFGFFQNCTVPVVSAHCSKKNTILKRCKSIRFSDTVDDLYKICTITAWWFWQTLLYFILFSNRADLSAFMSVFRNWRPVSRTMFHVLVFLSVQGGFHLWFLSGCEKMQPWTPEKSVYFTNKHHRSCWQPPIPAPWHCLTSCLTHDVAHLGFIQRIWFQNFGGVCPMFSVC